MDQAQKTSVLDRMLDPLSRCFDAESARRLAELQIDPVVQVRVDVLAERANEGLLTPEERAEYEEYINVSDLISILKLKVQRHLARGELSEQEFHARRQKALGELAELSQDLRLGY